ncbi:MAG: hypothetical protein AB7U82_27545 [Blastocatellales bacterium]
MIAAFEREIEALKAKPAFNRGAQEVVATLTGKYQKGIQVLEWVLDKTPEQPEGRNTQ